MIPNFGVPSASRLEAIASRLEATGQRTLPDDQMVKKYAFAACRLAVFLLTF